MRLAALAVLSLLFLGGCLDRRTVEVDQRRGFADRVQEVLDRRASSLAAGDTQGFLAPLTGDARRTEQVLADGFVGAPLTDPSFLVQVSSLTASSAPAELTARFRYRYEDLPEDNVFSFPVSYRVVGEGDRLRLSNSRFEQLPIWASGPVQVNRSAHFVSLSRPGAPGIDAVLATAESARSALEGRLPVALEQQALVVAALDHEEFQRLVSPSDSPAAGRVAQVSTTLQVTRSEALVQGRHVVVNLEQLARDRTGPETFRHELAHLALAPITRPTTAGWVAEGAAMYLAGTRPREAWASASSDGRFAELRFEQLSGAASLGAHDSGEAAASDQYAFAAAAAWYLVETAGEDRFWDFYRSFAERPASELYEALPAAGEPTTALDQLRRSATEQALDLEFDLRFDELDSRVRDWAAGAPDRA